ncbi:Zinc finger PHD-finger [Trinorchestia longiramus]|nr:Zinc finger PHD-finger [Trinorchestia longiramus]
MSQIEVDPLIRRGIRLLLSKAPDSLEQLKILADEALVAKQRSSGKLDLRRDSPISRSRHSSPAPNAFVGVGATRDLGKRDLHGQDDPGLSVVPNKRIRMADPSMPVTPHTPSPTPSHKSDGGSSKAGSRRSDESDQEPDMNDLADEITSGISCTVCKKISFYSVNQLVECQECHLIYHQECHKPPVSKVDITDPRRVWYCAKCTRNMRKQNSSAATTSNSSSSVSSSTRSGGSGSSKSSSSASSSRHAPSPAKTSSGLSASHHGPSPSKSSALGVSSSSGSSRPSPFTNLAAVSTRAALGADRSSASTNSSSREMKSSASAGSSTTNSSLLSRSDGSCGKLSSSVPTTAPSNSMLSAEKRMQMMKKKAAAKMAERRKI